MAKKKRSLAGRAWKLLKLAFKFKRGLRMKNRLAGNFLKSLRRRRRRPPSDMIYYGREREFTFDETPIIQFKVQKSNSMRLIRSILCINQPATDFDDYDVFFDHGGGTKSPVSEDSVVGPYEEDCSWEGGEVEEGKEEKCVDVKAEEFIQKFYEQQKLQRMLSFLQYYEMLYRSM